MPNRSLSIIIPLFNEEDNVLPLHARLLPVLHAMGHVYEIILVDDGSTDATAQRLHEIAQADSRVRVIHLRRNFGQTAAMMAGIDAATGDILIPMDGDLQNDPGDIPKLLAKLDEGYDVVSGWRKDRQDHPLKRNFPSRVANFLISRISGVHLHDYGCSLKAYRKEIIKGVKLYGEMHRFIPIYACWQGAKVTEVGVTHHPRVHGVSKYGIERTVKVILDLIVVKFLDKFAQKPMYLFGGFGLVSLGVSFLMFLAMLYLKLFGSKSFIETPLPLAVVLFFLMGFMSIFMGLISEILMRTYHESQNKPTYIVDRTQNCPGGE
ncbi:Dodecaprenyl-phosphate galacturonate synthase [Fundidesulfovibrio magnetotacticus]|uniref:Dodecaprenyl-phosphate galacturonate synthase n=1 Tax=Fundidesulfovibrio magnetotacticus TaxID=2730080 RepID=A0A6V8LTD5_9BACT|nr:glycosyltransferase family 2 protein [Fundidesulfovibrio magnetotacticus]GFK95732.1 Dodecaprenyl-phosphate galacturonate synthase [Fundidesulfovibrio magnetotacticus]